MDYQSTFKLIHYIINLQPSINKDILLSRMFLRKQNCLDKCGACCVPVSLDYYPGERWSKFQKQFPELVSLFDVLDVNNTPFPKKIISLNQQKISKNLKKCIFLNHDGRCEIHGVHPFLCDFEPIKVRIYKDKVLLTRMLLSRPHHLKKIDGTKGISCSWSEHKDLNRDKDLLREFSDIAEYFGYDTVIIKHAIDALDFLQRSTEHQFALLNTYERSYIMMYQGVKNV
jgi:Fe-S-cluster containining protein